jgi:MYXO-CTERM domain-containing protein
MRSALPLPQRGRAFYRLLRLIAAVVLGAIFLSRPAYAAGTVSLSTREPVESDGKWKLNMSIDYGGIPHLPHIPMLFSFTPTALYERALTDKTGDKPIQNRIPLQNQQSINESIDVGFSDASGKVFKVTKFDFAIRRDHGFEAGEYDLKITRADDGVQMGQTIKLTLKGDNPVVDRRAITFAGEKKPKKDDKKDDGADKKAADKPAESAEAKPEDKAEMPPEDPAGPPAVPPKQGGCGCRVGGAADTEEGGAALVLIGLGAALWARRRSPR